MTNNVNSGDRIRSILVLVATAATIAFNALAATGFVNGVTPEVISDKYPTVLTPAGYAFTIWSVIYLGIIAFSVYQLLPSQLGRFRPVRSLYIISCVLNCAWIYFWHRDQIGLCLVLIAALLCSLIFIIAAFKRPGQESGPLFTRAAFGVYGGWVTAATLVNFAIALKYFGIAFSPLMWNVVGAFALLLAAGLAILVRLRFSNYLYSLAIAWAATAIAVKQSGNTGIVVAASVCVIVCLVMAVSFVMDMKSSTT